MDRVPERLFDAALAGGFRRAGRQIFKLYTELD